MSLDYSGKWDSVPEQDDGGSNLLSVLERPTFCVLVSARTSSYLFAFDFQNSAIAHETSLLDFVSSLWAVEWLQYAYRLVLCVQDYINWCRFYGELLMDDVDDSAIRETVGTKK